MIRKLVFALSLIAGTSVHGLYAMPVGELPFERLVANTQTYIDAHPGDPRGYYIMARLYANAWAANAETFKIWQENSAEKPPAFEDRGASYGNAARMRSGPETGSPSHFRLALENYQQAIARISDADPPEASRIYFLGYAWLHEEGAKNPRVLGLPPHEDRSASLSESARERLREALEAYNGNPRSAKGRRLFRDRDAALTVAESIREDAPEYDGMLRFVAHAWILAAADYNEKVILASPHDPRRPSSPNSSLHHDQILDEACAAITALDDMDEQLRRSLASIVELARTRSDENAMRPRVMTPIVLSLTKETAFAALLAPDAAVRFDLDGDGTVERWPWVARDTALLVWIGDGTNRIDSGRDLIGSRTWWVFWKDGYEPLMFLDDDRDGWLRDAELDGLGLWFDRNGDGVAESSEVQSVTAHNIVGLNTRSDGRDGGTLRSSAGVALADGTVLPTWDWEPMERDDKDRRTWP